MQDCISKVVKEYSLSLQPCLGYVLKLHAKKMCNKANRMVIGGRNFHLVLAAPFLAVVHLLDETACKLQRS